MSITPQQATQVLQNADCLYDTATVQAAIARMGQEISGRLRESNPLVIGVLTGAIMPLGELLAHLDFPLQIDYVHATRYRGATSGSTLAWLARPQKSMHDRTVLIVDDILDEGVTLKAITEQFRREGAREVLSAVLTEKQHQRKNGFCADFVGLQVPDRYVFGYGMDYRDYLRNVPAIYAVRES